MAGPGNPEMNWLMCACRSATACKWVPALDSGDLSIMCTSILVLVFELPCVLAIRCKSVSCNMYRVLRGFTHNEFCIHLSECTHVMMDMQVSHLPTGPLEEVLVTTL